MYIFFKKVWETHVPDDPLLDPLCVHVVPAPGDPHRGLELQMIFQDAYDARVNTWKKKKVMYLYLATNF